MNIIEDPVKYAVERAKARWVNCRVDFDYYKKDYYYFYSDARRQNTLAKRDKVLICQDCGGAGGEIEPVLDYGAGPWVVCGWCRGIGELLPWERGQWLKMKREEKCQ